MTFIGLVKKAFIISIAIWILVVLISLLWYICVTYIDPVILTYIKAGLVLFVSIFIIVFFIMFLAKTEFDY